jgi:hypothetical protein
MIKIEDNSNDKLYFTMVPNFVLNHSSAVDQALYLQMKRVAGEDGNCFMTEETMCRKLGIGQKKLHKSLKYLIKHKWIEFIGMTPSKTRPIKTYRITDIWGLNATFYSKKKIPLKSGVSKDTSQKEKDTLQKKGMIPAKSNGIRRTNIKEEPIKKKYNSLSLLTELDFEEIAEKYNVPISFVRSKFEDLENYCGAKGRRYKNYRLALMGFVKRDALKIRQDYSNANNKRAIDASNL